jgi:hypothetical protein
MILTQVTFLDSVIAYRLSKTDCTGKGKPSRARTSIAIALECLVWRHDLPFVCVGAYNDDETIITYPTPEEIVAANSDSKGNGRVMLLVSLSGHELGGFYFLVSLTSNNLHYRTTHDYKT